MNEVIFQRQQSWKIKKIIKQRTEASATLQTGQQRLPVAKDTGLLPTLDRECPVRSTAMIRYEGQHPNHNTGIYTAAVFSPEYPTHTTKKNRQFWIFSSMIA